MKKSLYQGILAMLGVLAPGKQTRMSCIGWVRRFRNVTEFVVAGCYLGLFLTLADTLSLCRTCCMEQIQVCRVRGGVQLTLQAWRGTVTGLCCSWRPRNLVR